MEHECEVTQADLNDLRHELINMIEDLQREVHELRAFATDFTP